MFQTLPWVIYFFLAGLIHQYPFSSLLMISLTLHLITLPLNPLHHHQIHVLQFHSWLFSCSIEGIMNLILGLFILIDFTALVVLLLLLPGFLCRIRLDHFSKQYTWGAIFNSICQWGNQLGCMDKKDWDIDTLSSSLKSFVKSVGHIFCFWWSIR